MIWAVWPLATILAGAMLTGWRWWQTRRQAQETSHYLAYLAQVYASRPVSHPVSHPVSRPVSRPMSQGLWQMAAVSAAIRQLEPAAASTGQRHRTVPRRDPGDHPARYGFATDTACYQADTCMLDHTCPHWYGCKRIDTEDQTPPPGGPGKGDLITIAMPDGTRTTSRITSIDPGPDGTVTWTLESAQQPSPGGRVIHDLDLSHSSYGPTCSHACPDGST